MRRPRLQQALMLAAIGIVLLAGLSIAHRSSASDAMSGTESGERIVKIVAKRFSYTPDEIVLKKGEPVTLRFTSIDFVHGFKVPALGLRADLPPGAPIDIHLVPQTTGRFPFLCDNFCGGGHEEMDGVIVVRE